MSADKEIKIKVDLETYKKLKDQLEQMRLVNVPGIEVCNSVEDLISFYIKQIFKMDTLLLEGMMSIIKKYSGDNRFHQAFKEIMEGGKGYDSTDSSSFGTLFEDDEDDEDFDDEFYYYEDEEEEFEENDKLERVDINSEEYKERQRKYEEEKKKNKK